MKLLRKKKKLEEEQALRYLEPIQPSLIDNQKLIILNKYDERLKLQIEKFTCPRSMFKERTSFIMSRLSAHHIQTYPSNLIIKILKRIDQSRKYFIDAFNFIQEEHKHWPHIHLEVIFMDFLFNPINNIPKNEATLLIALLIDLQEDFRLTIKRDFIKYFLRFDDLRKALWLEVEPPEYPIMTLRAPVMWKSSVQVAKNRLEEILMTTHPVLQAISMLWRQLLVMILHVYVEVFIYIFIFFRYHDVVVLNISKFFNDPIPFHADKVSEFLKQSCVVTRDVSIRNSEESKSFFKKWIYVVSRTSKWNMK